MGPLRTFLLAGTLLALPVTPDLAQVESMLDVPSARQADTLDIVSSGGLLSHVAYETRPPTTTPVLPSPLPSLKLSPRLTRFGSIAANGGEYRKTGPQAGGLLLDLGASGKVRNLLAYHTLQLAGTWSGTWQVALMDEAQAKRKEQTHLGFLDQKAATFYLNQTVATGTDLSRARYLVFSLATPQGKLNLRSISFNRVDTPPLPQRQGVWLLNTPKLLKTPDAIAEDLAAKGFRRAYVQLPDSPASLYPFLRAASKAGVEVYALDGAPDDLKHSVALLTRVAEVIDYNRSYGEAPFAGLQLDIAPHDLRDFGIRRSYYIERYLALLNDVATQCASVLPLSIIVPHWFPGIPANGLNLAAKTLSRADEMVVTCDRTKFSELVQRSREALLWGERFNKPVFVGIKAGPVPDEGHLLLRKNGSKKGKTVSLAGMQWEQEAAYTISASQVTFAGDPAALNTLLTKAPPSPAFAGWVISSYENLK